MPVTLRDVAARAGVSPIVVSRVLHNKALTVRVSEATAERVRVAARELDYRLNVSAMNFRNQQTRTIGILYGWELQDIRFDDRGGYLSSLMQGFVEAAFECDYSLVLCPRLTGSDPKEAMSNGRFDGLVWRCAVEPQRYRSAVDACPVPLVVVHGTQDEYRGVRSTVICDNRQGIGLIVDHLVSLGHKRFLYVLATKANQEALIRLRCLEEHLHERGLPFGPEDVLDVSNGLGPAREYLSHPLRHTAAVCFVDHTAGEMIRLAQEAGIKVPEQLSVVGFDSTPFCDEFRPKITSVRQPIAQLGKRAIQVLVEELQGSGARKRNELVPCTLDIRESTGPAA